MPRQSLRSPLERHLRSSSRPQQPSRTWRHPPSCRRLRGESSSNGTKAEWTSKSSSTPTTHRLGMPKMWQAARQQKRSLPRTTPPFACGWLGLQTDRRQFMPIRFLTRLPTPWSAARRRGAAGGVLRSTRNGSSSLRLSKDQVSLGGVHETGASSPRRASGSGYFGRKRVATYVSASLSPSRTVPGPLRT